MFQNNKIFGAIIILAILLSAGVTYYRRVVEKDFVILLPNVESDAADAAAADATAATSTDGSAEATSSDARPAAAASTTTSAQIEATTTLH